MSRPQAGDGRTEKGWPAPTALHWSEIADALWLASRPGFAPDYPAAGPDRAGHRPSGEAEDTDEAGLVRTPGEADHPGGGRDDPSVTQPARQAFIGSAPDRPAAPGSPPVLRVPAERPGVFQALRNEVESDRELVLDEEATAERGAIDHRWLPVLRPALERRWNAVLVVDTGPSMWIWDGYVGSVAAMLERQGVFRDVRLRTLGPDGRGGVELGSPTGRLPTAPAGIVDPTGRTVVLVLTDGCAEIWWNGAAQAALALWGTHMIVAVLNPLPQQRWSQTALYAKRTWMHSAAPEPTARMSWTRSAVDDMDPALAELTRPIAVPVLEVDGRWLRRWAELLSGTGSGSIALPAMLISHQRSPSSAPSEFHAPPESADYLVARFRATASPLAIKLAIRLAAAPLNVRTMLAVQRRLPRAGPHELAEVLISRLIRPVAPSREVTDPTRVTFEFADQVRERLLALGQRDHTIEVLHTIEDELSGTVEAVRGLAQRIAAPQSADYPDPTAVNEPFLKVEMAVTKALSGPHLAAARKLEQLLRRPREAALVAQEAALVARVQAGVPGLAEAPETADVAAVPQARLDALLGRDDLRAAGPFADGIYPRPTGPGSAGRADSINNLPPRNVNFTGRAQLLDALARRLRSGTTAVLPEALHGAGGVGKSQLVVEYMHLHKDDYELVWWISAERPAQVRTAFVELAQRLGLPVAPSASASVPAVMDALRKGRASANWLLVFDNAERPEDIQQFFPLPGPGSIIVTSRDPAWADFANELKVDVFSRPESTELLRRRIPDLTDVDADRLATALGDLPLAIEQAAAWCAETAMTPDEYLRLLDESRPALTETVTGNDHPPDYPESIAAAWSMSLNALRDRDPTALRLLQVCAFFAPEPISRTLLSTARGAGIHPDLDPVLRSSTLFNQAVRTIGRYSLARIDYRTNSLHMHRLVQLVLVAQMEPAEREELRHSAHLLLAGNDPNLPQETDHWPRYAELYPHVVASEALDCPHDYVRDLVLNEAKYLFRWGDLHGARDLSQHAYTALVRAEGPSHLDTLRMANWLGYMHFVVGAYQAAADLNANTLQLYRRALGDDREETLDAIGAVAADLRVKGDFASALDQSLTVYERARRSFGEGDAFTLRSAHNLAVSLRLSGLFSRALQLDEQTYAQLIQVLSADHLETLNTRGGINLDRRELGDHITARADQETLVAVLRRLLPDDQNPHLLIQTQILAVARRKAGKLIEALELSTYVLRRYQARYGDAYPETTLARLTCSIDMRTTGDLPGARAAGEQTAAEMRQLYGSQHPHTASADANLAVTLRLQGNVEDARRRDEQALHRLTARLGRSHAVVLHTAINLASDYHATGGLWTAYTQDSALLPLCREQLGVNHPTTLACGVNLAMDLRDLGRPEEADRLLTGTVARFRTVLGDTHPATMGAVSGARANCDIDPLPL